jgi:hypothetical protein
MHAEILSQGTVDPGVFGVTPPFVKNCMLRSKADWNRLAPKRVAACDFEGLRRGANDNLR